MTTEMESGEITEVNETSYLVSRKNAEGDIYP